MIQNRVTKLLRAIAWLLIVVICLLSLLLPSQRPVTGAPHNFEHLAIFMLTGLAFGLGYRLRHLTQAAGLIAFAGAIEIAQYWVPGRHARTSDFIVDAASACAGVIGAWLSIQILNRYSPIIRGNRPRLSAPKGPTKYAADRT